MKRKGLVWLFSFFLCTLTSNAFAQEYTVTGKVTDTENNPIPGITIVVKGTTIGTVTDIDGNYSINIASGDTTLQFSAVGYVSQEISVAGSQELNIKLEEELTALSEVVVIGYGTQKSSLVTGAISSIKSKDIENRSVSRAEQALQGKTAGVYVLPESGSPGAGMKVRIRGIGTNGNANPLFIVDGIKTDDINTLDPNDIESMEVLKDGAASAIYGAEGGNGVVIITTKSGKAGDGVVSYSFQYGIQSAGKLPELMNAEQYGTYINEGGLLNIDPTEYQGKTGTNWMEEIYDNAPMQKHYLSFSGGTEKTKYLSSISYLNQDGIMGGDKANFERFTARINADHKIKKWMTVGANITYSKTNRASLQEDDEFGGVMANGLMIDPLTPTHYAANEIPSHVQGYIDGGEPVRAAPDGRVFGISRYIQGETVNPVLMHDIANGVEAIDKLLGNFSLNIDLYKGLKFTSRPGVSFTHSNTHNYTPTYYYSSERNNSTLGVNDNVWTRKKWQWDNFLTYDVKFSQHNFNFIVGMSSEGMKLRFNDSYSAPMAVESESYAEHFYTTSRDNDRSEGNEFEEALLSYFGRMSYDYDGKYLLQATIRRDGAGSSLIHPDNKWGLFPSFSAGWVVSNEDFWTVDFVNFFKARASWGRNGSIKSLRGDGTVENYFEVGQYRYLPSITSAGLRYPLPDGSFVPASEPLFLENKDLTWETSQQTNFGVDLRAWENRLTLTVDYFNKTTKNLILEESTPPLSSGNNPPSKNVGDVENKGFEFNLGLRNMDKEFKYGVNFNFTTMKNEVTRLNDPAPRIPGSDIGTGWSGATSFEVGKPIWFFRGYQTNGIDPATGDPIFVDVDGDGTIDEEDRTDIGSPHPTFIYGANINLEYKGIDLNVFVQGQSGNDVIMGWIRTDRQTGNKPTYFYEDRWTPTNTSGSMPRSNPDSRTWTSDMMVFDGAFTRIKQIQIGYTLPKSLLETAKISTLRVYFSLDDYFTFTKYEGVDPEAGSSDNTSIGIDRGVYPVPRKVMFGLNVSF